MEDIIDNAKNFPKLMKDINPQTEDSLQTPNRSKKTKTKMQNNPINTHHSVTAENKLKKKILKGGIEKRNIP